MKKFLIIEDEPNWRVKIETALSNDDFQSVSVSDDFNRLCSKGISPKLKATLIQILRENYSDLRVIICDLGLKNKIGSEQNKNYRSGLEVISWIRDGKKEEFGIPEEFLSEIPIIACTATVDNDDHIAAIKAGADDVQIKGEENFNENIQGIVTPRVERFHKKCKFISFYNRKIGISYTWQHKDTKHHEFVNEIAQLLYSHYGAEKVFFDEKEQIKGFSPGLNKEQFSELYAKECEFILVCVSNDYNKGRDSWTKTEWTKIKSVFEKDKNRVLFLPIEKLDAKETFAKTLQIKDSDLKDLFLMDATEIREDYYKVLEGKNDKQQAVWNRLLEKDSLVKDYVVAIFKERKDIIKKIDDKIVSSIINNIDQRMQR